MGDNEGLELDNAVTEPSTVWKSFAPTPYYSMEHVLGKATFIDNQCC